MELSFIEIDVPKTKEHYLQHIHQLVLVSLSAGDTYLDLFEKTKERFKNRPPEELSAAEDWINFNLEGQEDKEVFKSVITTEDGQYAMFDLINK